MSITGATTATPDGITGDWVRYVWNLRKLQPVSPLPAPYLAAEAAPEKRDAVLEVVVAAYASDATWARIRDRIRDRMKTRISETIGTPGAAYVTLTEGDEIVAVSGLARDHWTDQNLLTGICVLPPHQRRGLGTWLLAASLKRLRDMGLDAARVYTESGSLADRKIYPLYDGRREAHVEYPGAASSREGVRQSAVAEERS